MLDNLDVAVFTKLNDLAERHGLKPYDFVAAFLSHEDRQEYLLRFEVPAWESALQAQRFERMLRDLGIGVGGRHELKGSPAQIVDALDHALRLSPKLRSLF